MSNTTSLMQCHKHYAAMNIINNIIAHVSNKIYMQEGHKHYLPMKIIKYRTKGLCNTQFNWEKHNEQNKTTKVQ